MELLRNAKVLFDKVIVRITKEMRETIYTKEIVRNDGTKVKLWKTVPAKDEIDERISALFVQTAIVEAAGKEIDWIKVGDIAIVDYNLCNSKDKFFMKDNEDTLFWFNANTTYHKQDEIVYQNRKTKRDQIVNSKGDYDSLSLLLGVIRDNELIANSPYVFLEHESTVVSKVSNTGILYQEKQKMLSRKVLAISKDSEMRYGIKKGDEVLVDDFDIFTVKLTDDHIIDCVNDRDIVANSQLLENLSSFLKK